MKKFLLPMLLALAILFPTMQVSAAYVFVPNFRKMTSNTMQIRIKYDGMEQKNNNGVAYTSWHYTCLDGKTADYVAKYIKRIGNRPDFQLLGQSGANWFFAYKGGQARYLKAFDGGFHVHVGASGNDVVVNMVAGMYPES